MQYIISDRYYEDVDNRDKLVKWNWIWNKFKLVEENAHIEVFLKRENEKYAKNQFHENMVLVNNSNFIIQNSRLSRVFNLLYGEHQKTC